MRKAEATVGSVVFFALNPAMMGAAVPLLLTRWHSAHPPRALSLLGVALIAAGTVLLLDTIARFVFEGSGTPHPAAPTQELVIGGPYRYVRNPMYIGVLIAIFGQALLLGRPALMIYGAVFWLVVASFARFYEEPTLSEQYGQQYAAYRRAVPGWRPRPRPWSPAPPGPAR